MTQLARPARCHNCGRFLSNDDIVTGRVRWITLGATQDGQTANDAPLCPIRCDSRERINWRDVAIYGGDLGL